MRISHTEAVRPLLVVLVILVHHRRRIVHVAVTVRPERKKWMTNRI
jgi:hypothetical protein